MTTSQNTGGNWRCFSYPLTGPNSTRRNAFGITPASTPRIIVTSDLPTNCVILCSILSEISAVIQKKSKDSSSLFCEMMSNYLCASIYDYFAKHRRQLEVFQLPPYWPELNAQERIWHYTRKHATHNRYFGSPDELCDTLFHTFGNIRRHPEEIQGLLEPFL